MIQRLLKSYQVYAAAPFIAESTKQTLEGWGVICVSNTFERTGLNVVKDLTALIKFRKQIKKIHPDVVLAYTIKPVVFGLKAANLRGVQRFALITGKGSSFEAHNFKAKFISYLVKILYRDTLKSVDGVIFQNTDDQKFFNQQSLVNSSVNQTVIEGTGVDMNYYYGDPNDEIPNRVRFLFIARLIKEKGIPELIAAARRLKDQGYPFEVQILGWIDPNPGGISKEEVEQMQASGVVNYLGTTDDVRPFIRKADVFVLPTYYNEGLPRTIQEAMAMRKPIITTDHPGCRETVDDGKNGFLIPIKDAEALAKAMEYFINHPEQVKPMGKVSYQLAKQKFEVSLINERLLNFMQTNGV